MFCRLRLEKKDCHLDTAEKVMFQIGTPDQSEPWLVGKDVAEVLGYKNTKDALSRHVDADDKQQNDGVAFHDPIGREQYPTIINESGLYSLILSSKLPSCFPTLFRSVGRFSSSCS